MSRLTSKLVAAADQWSDPLSVAEGHALAVSVINVSGPFNGTVAVQRSFESTGDDWRTFATDAGTDSREFDVPALVHGCRIRVGCSAFTAGSAKLELRVSITRMA